MCSLLCGRVSTTSLEGSSGLGLAGGPCWAAALWNCFFSVQILEAFHTEPLPVYQKRRSSFSPCAFKGNVLVGRQERDSSPSGAAGALWGCFLQSSTWCALLVCCCHFFWPKLIKMFGEHLVLNHRACPSWGDCGARQQHLHKAAVSGPELLGRHGRTARQPLTTSSDRSAVPWFAATFLENRKNKRLFNSDHSKVLWKHVAAIFKVFLLVVVDMWDYAQSSRDSGYFVRIVSVNIWP